MNRIYLLLVAVLMGCIGCEWQLRPSSEQALAGTVTVDRYDRLQRLYLSSGDVAALQQMTTNYPTETRVLIEDVLQLGPANDPEIKKKWLFFFQDSILQMLMQDVAKEYEDVSDIESQLSLSFENMQKLIPSFEVPHVYTQISSLDQSIVAGEGFLGISLDKYLGSNYPLYIKYGYSERQRSMMTRSFIVPDCLGFYLLSLYPMATDDTTRLSRDRHMGKIQYVVNTVTEKRIFDNEHVKHAEQLMTKNKNFSVEKLLKSLD